MGRPIGRILLLLFLLLILIFASWSSEGEEPVKPHALSIESSAFEYGDPIPRDYACDGSDISPPLSWSNAPPETKSFVLICDDPDAPAGTWVHWVYYDIPSNVTQLPEAFPPDERPEAKGAQGITDFKRIGYGGPCPPGGTHRYFFKLYALDTVLGLDPGASKRQVLRAAEGHVLAEAQLMGTYSR